MNLAPLGAAVPGWPRPHYKPSASKASLFYLVFGEPPAHLNVKRAVHHVGQLPPELRVSVHARGDDAAWFDGWLSPPVGLEIPHVFGEGADAVYAAQRVAAVRAEFADPSSLAYLRDTVGVVSAIAEGGAVAIFDVPALTWWRPEEWRRRFVDRSEFHIGDHIFTAVSREVPSDASNEGGGGGGAGTLALHTRGLGKFGRPELLVRHLPGGGGADGPAARAAAEVMDGLSNYLARGGVITDGETMHLARYDASIVFFDSTPPRAEQTVFEICDVSGRTGLSGDGIPSLLKKISERQDAGK